MNSFLINTVVTIPRLQPLGVTKHWLNESMTKGKNTIGMLEFGF